MSFRRFLCLMYAPATIEAATIEAELAALTAGGWLASDLLLRYAQATARGGRR